ncbi:MAG: hypothetical protein K2Q18_04130 [Bdellovibrionales bacterium]|nr:hypothetical protein [Bdellovibrionales bacterium]
MINDLFENIQEHLCLLELAVASSQKIKAHSIIENVDAVSNEADNRERLVNVLNVVQQKIEEQINQLNAALLTADDIGILKSWFQDLSTFSEKMIELDKETVEILAQQKEDTTKEIAHLFKNKEMFKGYNHSTKK